MDKKKTHDSVFSKLKPAQVIEITQAFVDFDGNQNGSITPDEMKECLRRSNVEYNDTDVNQVIASMDSNKDGTVSYEEYMKFMVRVYTGQLEQFKLGQPSSSKTTTSQKK